MADGKICPRCAETVREQATICRFCGHDFQSAAGSVTPTPESARSGLSKTAKFGLGCFGLLVVLGVIGMMLGPPPPTSTRVSPAASSSSQASSDKQSETGGARFSFRKITGDEYARIREGMTYTEVARIVGDPGEEISSSDIAGYRTVMYSWVNFDGSNANAMFQNGRMVTKAQFGL